jgi:hypothetical protein
MLLSLGIWNSAGWEDVGMLAGEVFLFSLPPFLFILFSKNLNKIKF